MLLERLLLMTRIGGLHEDDYRLGNRGGRKVDYFDADEGSFGAAAQLLYFMIAAAAEELNMSLFLFLLLWDGFLLDS